MSGVMLGLWIVGGCIAATSYIPFRIAHRMMRDYDGSESSFDPWESAMEYRFFGCMFIVIGLIPIVMGSIAEHRF